jgi:hypothetical protein
MDSPLLRPLKAKRSDSIVEQHLHLRRVYVGLIPPLETGVNGLWQSLALYGVDTGLNGLIADADRVLGEGPFRVRE